MVKRILAIFLFTVIVFSIVACAIVEPSLVTINLTVVVFGKHTNSIDMTSQVMEDAKLQLSKYGSKGYISFIHLDGTPAVIEFTDAVFIEAYSSFYSNRAERYFTGDSAGRQKWERDYLNPLLYAYRISLEESEPDSDEVDTYDAIRKAVSLLNNMEREYAENTAVDIQKNIIIYDTGICTVGDVDFTNSVLRTLIENENEPTKEKLVETGVVTKYNYIDLTGVSVKWVGIGAASGEQRRFVDSRIKYNLERFWECAFDADEITFFESTGNNEYSCEQKVSLVRFSVGTEHDDYDIFVSEESLGGFEPNLAFYLNHDDTHAKEVLAPVAEEMRNNQQIIFYIVGTTTSYGDGDGGDLSKKRAETVMQTLIELGVNENQIVPHGVGYNYEDGWCIEEDDGVYLSENRGVHIVSVNSQKGKLLLSKTA